MPVKAEKKVLGVVNAESPIPGRFGPAEKQLLEVLASQAAISIANARLFADTRRLETFNAGIVQSLAEGILIEDPDGIISFANPAAEEILGYGRGEILGKHWAALVSPDFRSRLAVVAAQRMAGEPGRYEAEFLTKTAAGSPCS